MTRVVAIPVLLALAIGLGYSAVITDGSPKTILIDVGFVASIAGFLILVVAELGERLRRPLRAHDAEQYQQRPPALAANGTPDAGVHDKGRHAERR